MAATNEEDKEITTSRIDREAYKNAEIPSIYANDIQVQTSPWDIRFTFGLIRGVSTDGVLKVIPSAEVHVSPQLAKRLLTILTAQIQSYEQRIGAIPEPDRSDTSKI